jgi:SagB-type dehydrogenase family enzyme
MSPFETIIGYHQATKHHFDRYARSAGYLDWANQPDPFRTYENSPQVPLPLTVEAPEMPYDQLFGVPPPPPRPFTRETISLFFLYALGLSAWKSDGTSRWPLRINPSSGNLHPTEGYLIAPRLHGLPAGVYHYAPLPHALEQRAVLPEPLADRLENHLGGQGFWVALSSIFWRESWKYGERAFRYCQLDVGHALAALAFAARLNGWRLSEMNDVGDDQIDILLGFDRTAWRPLEDEVPEVLCRVSPGEIEEAGATAVPEDLISAFTDLTINGRPNTLSGQPVDWPIIAQAARATRKSATSIPVSPWEDRPTFFPPPAHLTAARVLRQRRSAVSYDPEKAIPSHTFLAILERTLPSAAPPFNFQLMPPGVDLLVFVHRVTDVPSGLYLLARRPDSVTSLRTALDPGFAWQRLVSDLPLYLLHAADMTDEAMTLSCHQAIAGHSALAVAMLADFHAPIARNTFAYRNLHWECGMIGQVLYLEAEAWGLRGTGIGCYFDDEVHRMLGLADLSRQVLYHFTLGHPIEDKRLTTLQPYHHRGVF